MNVDKPNRLERYVDQSGRLTLEGIKLLEKIVNGMQSLDERVTALEP